MIDVRSAALDVPARLVDVGAALGADPRHWLLTGGDDHALAATFPPDVLLPVRLDPDRRRALPGRRRAGRARRRARLRRRPGGLGPLRRLTAAAGRGCGAVLPVRRSRGDAVIGLGRWPARAARRSARVRARSGASRAPEPNCRRYRSRSRATSAPWWITSRWMCSTSAAIGYSAYGPSAGPQGAASAAASSPRTPAVHRSYASSSWASASSAVPA